MNALWLLFVAALLAFAQALVFSLFNLRGLTYSRAFDRKSAHEGEQVERIEILHNRKPLPVPWLRAESRISPNLQFGKLKAEEREISGDRFHKSLFFLAPYSKVTRRHGVTCLRRGYYPVGSVALTASDLFALVVKSRQQDLQGALFVYPRLLSDDELETPSSRWQGDMSVRRWIAPDPFLTAGIRGYLPGDALRDIHWGATARTGQLQIKVRDYTADPRAMVLLNVQATENQWNDLMDYEQEEIEQGLRIAATLCMRALECGVDAGFGTNACLLGEEGQRKSVVVMPSRAAGQDTLLLETMARLSIHRELNFTTFLDGLSTVADTDILILSMYDSEAIREKIAMLKGNGNSVELLPLRREAAV